MPTRAAPDTFTTFGDLLRFLRRRAGLTQEALGRAVGYTGAHIGRLEANERRPDVDALAARFVTALLLEDEPQTVARLLALAAAARGEPLPAAYQISARAEAAPALTAGAEGNLPAAWTSFVGRERELAETRQLLAGVRVLTLVGAGGSGKTRLALEAAGRAASLFPHGVWLVELAPLTDPQLVAGAVAAALGVPVRADRPVVDTLRDYVAARQALLLLDNCEHLARAVAELVEALLPAGPHWRVLATSREALRAAGEVVYRVPPLALPDRRTAEVAVVAGSEAARLFVERARAVRPGFELTAANASAVADICRRVDGLPLALELAAARLSALSVTDLAARLAADDGLRLLSGGRRTAQARQATVEALLEWSYVLLSARERALLRQLAVLPGGWPLPVAEALATPGSEVVTDLTQLVDKSLVVMDDSGAGEAARYRLLEPIRQFAGSKLEAAGEAAAARNRHLAYWTAWMEAAVPRLEGPEQGAWLLRIEAEHHHLRAALAWTLEPGADWPAGLRLAVAALGNFSLVRGHLREGLDWARALLERATDPVDRPSRARLLGRAAQLAYFRFEFAQGLAWSQEGGALCRALNDPLGQAEALWAEGVILASLEDYAAARVALEACVAVCRPLPGGYRLSAALVSLGRVLDFQPGEDGRPLIGEGLALAERLGDTWGQARALLALGNSLGERQAFGAARAAYERGLALAQQLGDPFTHAGVLQSLALVLHMLDDFELSGRYAAEAARLYADLGDQVQPPFVQRMQGYAALHADDWVQAQRYLAASLRGNQALGHRLGQAGGLLALAALAEATGDHQRAAVLGGCAAAQAAGADLIGADARTLQQLAARLSGEPAWQHGQTLTLEQGVALALSDG